MEHRKQFAILKYALELPGFRSVSLRDGWVLSAHEQLPVFHDAQKQVTLLGYAWQALPGKGSPAEQLQALKPGRTGCPTWSSS